MNPQSPQPPLIRASELAQYGFCRRAWWLAVVKKVPAGQSESRERGSLYHRQHLAQVRVVQRWRRAGLVLWGGGLVLLLATLLFWLGTG